MTYIQSRLTKLTEYEARLIVLPLRMFTANQFRVWLEGQAYGQANMRSLWCAWNRPGP